MRGTNSEGHFRGFEFPVKGSNEKREILVPTNSMTNVMSNEYKVKGMKIKVYEMKVGWDLLQDFIWRAASSIYYYQVGRDFLEN